MEYLQAKKEAKKISKLEGVTQHVNKKSSGVYKVEDFFDYSETVASFEAGEEL